jgi:VIT1/CCC1 family predicted Fe2+/Mn2+ transporter
VRLIDDWKNAHRLSSIWVAGFWGGFGGLLCILPAFINMDNLWILGPIILFMSITFAIARVTKQPGIDQ